MAKVLVIDDDRMVRTTLRLILSAAGHNVVLAKDGKEGLQALQQAQPDLVITDMLMPERTGAETIAELRKRLPQMPIIAVSGGGRIGNLDFLEIARELGADQTLQKPFEPDLLVSAIANLLKAA